VCVGEKRDRGGRLAEEGKAPAESPAPETHAEEPREEEALGRLLGGQDLAEELHVAAVLDLDDLLGGRLVEDHIDQAHEALALGDAQTRVRDLLAVVEVELDWLAGGRLDGEVEVGAVVERARIQLEDPVLDGGHLGLVLVAAQAEHLEVGREGALELDASRALDDAAEAAARELLGLAAEDALRRVLSHWNGVPLELLGHG